jgi:hypothetical protein
MARSPRTGKPYAPGVSGVAFFDSAARLAARAAAPGDGPGGQPQGPIARLLRPTAPRYGDTQALAFATARTGYIVLRGTESLADLAADFHDAPTDETYARLPTLEQTLVGAPRPARHTGFAIAWGTLAPKVAGPAFQQAYENPALGLDDRTLRLKAADDLITLLDRR